MNNYLDLGITEINKLLKEKKILPIDLVNEAIDRIEKNSDLNCFITLNKEEALKCAKELENKEVDNLLFGLPIAIKDNICTKNIIIGKLIWMSLHVVLLTEQVILEMF